MISVAKTELTTSWRKRIAWEVDAGSHKTDVALLNEYVCIYDLGSLILLY
jgi:hypothetical protein